MPITQADFDTLLADPDKWISVDLHWSQDPDHSPAVVFKADVESSAGYPISVRARYNQAAGKLSFSMIHKETGRIYGLDMGSEHHNPSCEMVGEIHKHKWRDAVADKEAYPPPDITAPLDEPVQVWRQFCTEANIDHRGSLARPEIQQEFGV